MLTQLKLEKSSLSWQNGDIHLHRYSVKRLPFAIYDFKSSCFHLNVTGFVLVTCFTTHKIDE